MYRSIYKPNQILRVKRFDTFDNAPDHWLPAMISYMNKVVIVEKIADHGLVLETNHFLWDDGDFEKVNTNVQ